EEAPLLEPGPALERAEESRLDFLGRDVGEPAAAYLRERGLLLVRDLLTRRGEHALGCLDRARQAAHDHVVEAHAALGIERAGRIRLLPARCVERHRERR